jgi:hypothetical protein
LGGVDGLAVYAHGELYGQNIIGPCVVDGGTFTWLIGAGWFLAVDSRGDAIVTKESSL